MSFNSLSIQIAILGGLGRSRFAPGTTATFLAGIPMAIFLGFIPELSAFFLIAAITLLACAVSDRAEKGMGRHDPKEIVIDELAGYLVATIALPINTGSLFLCFVFFRLFDIWKPWPIRYVETAVKGGFGIVLDDILAGVAANAASRFILYLWQ